MKKSLKKTIRRTSRKKFRFGHITEVKSLQEYNKIPDNEKQYIISLKLKSKKEIDILNILKKDAKKWRSLKNLDLSENYLGSLPDSIKDLQNLQTLNLASNSLTTIPKIPPSLQTLNLMSNSIEGLEGLEGLSSLNLSFNNLKNVPEFTGSLQDLDLSGNKIESFPEFIEGLQGLMVLNLSRNKLKNIPESIEDLKKLHYLDLSQNQLTSIPASIGNLQSLIYLNLSENQLTRIPQEIGDLKTLYELNLFNNKITEFCPKIGSYKALLKLDLSVNKLKNICKNIEGLQNLIDLWVFENQLKELPLEIGSLHNLQNLIIADNRISKIPIEITLLRNLTSFDYSRNPIKNISPVIRRFIDSLEHRHRLADIYGAESVHNTTLQKSVNDSINRIIEEELPIQDLENYIKNNKILTLETKQDLLRYCESTSEHTIHGVTFRDLLSPILTIIQRHKESDELLKRMNEEMKDSRAICFTGRLTRLLNVLSGYDDRVNLEISNSDQIAAIILMTKLSLGSKYNVDAHKKLVSSEMRERSFPEDEIELWVSQIE